MFKRLFIALELPAAIRAELARIDPHIRGVRWVAAGQMHLTVSFLGDVDDPHFERLREELAGVEVPAFFLPVTGIGIFGGERPRTVWAGVGKGHPHLFLLHRRIQDAVLRAGLEPDLKPFHPHITLGRMRGVSRATLKPFLRRHAETEFGLWKVTGFVLFSSVLAPEGSSHTVELRREFPAQ
jgi:2'-5' RNA ligase